MTACLLACEQSNVIVVVPGRRGRRAGGRPTWFGQVLDDGAVAAIAEWVNGGGPGLAAVPDRVQGMVTDPIRRDIAGRAGGLLSAPGAGDAGN